MPNLHTSLKSCVAVLALACAFPTFAAVQDVVRLQMGESDSGPSAQVMCKATGTELTATGSPTPTDGIADKANQVLGSTHAIIFKAGDGYTLDGLPANPKNNVGIELWVKPESQGGFRNLVNFGGSSGIGIAQQNEGVWGMVYGKASIGFRAIKPGQWVHLAVVIDGGVGRFFVNGKPAGTAANAASWGYPKSRSMTLGLPLQKGHKPFEGTIDEVRVFTFEPGTFDPSALLYTNQPKPQDTPDSNTADANADFNGTLAEIVFNRTPRENGLTFSRANMSYASANGKTAWRVNRSTLGQMQWMRDANLTFTDPAFRNGSMPVVDVEAVVRLNTWAGITAYADTQRGSTRGNMVWGASPNWRTLRFQLDDAHFGARDHGSSGRELQSDGYDLRLFGANQPLFVHRVTVKGYARTGDVDWARLIRVTPPRGDGKHADTELLMFSADEPIRLTMPIRNLALEPTTVAYTFRLINGDDQVVAERTGNFSLAANQPSRMDLEFDTAGWDLGPYRYEYRLDHPSKNIRLATLDGYVGVYEPGNIRKARDNEFWFGLQHTGDPIQPRNAAWLDLMGVDILRGGLKTHARLDSNPTTTDRTYAELFRRGIRVMPMMDPPKPGSPVKYDADGMDPEKRDRELKKQERFLEDFARRYADTVTYYELGNEPDLKFFYPGPIEEYADSFTRMRAAIKRGNPNAIVMTGGLCFHGKDGDRRARKLIELLGADGVDAWSYHSHGPGYEAQKKGYERQVEATAKHNADHLPMIDTETGMAATGVSQVHEQARTVVEKFVYTMSKRSPMTFFFALHFKEGSGAYTMVERDREPRPVVLAYRNLVRTLRGSQFVADVEGVSSSLRVYRFADPETGRQTLVGWSQADQPTTLRMAVNATPGSTESIDLFGNRTPLPQAANSVEVTIGPDPIYVTWLDPDAKGAEPDTGLAVLPALLETPQTIPAAGGDTTSFDLLVRRPGESVDSATLRTRLILNDQTAVEQSQPVAFGGSDSTNVTVGLEVPADYATPVFAGVWRVHADFPARQRLADLPGQQLTQLQNKIGGADGAWLPMSPAVEIDALAGGHAERAPAIAMTRVWAPMDGTFRIGAAADWWMAWYVNGEPVYDTLARGNGGGLSPTAHTFDAPLNAGWNTVAARVLSGRGGWKLTAAGPSELAMMLRPESPPDRVELTLEDASGAVLTTSMVPVLPMPVAAPLDAGRNAMHPPLAALTPDDVTNFHEAHPDANRWYAGADDLSALLWIAAGADRQVEATVDLTDDRYRAATDNVELVLQTAEGKVAIPLERSGVASVPGAVRFSGSMQMPAGVHTVVAKLTVLDDDGVSDGPKQRGEIVTPVKLWPANR